jgi:hypothetical protein
MLTHQAAFSILAIESAFNRIIKKCPKQPTEEEDKKFQQDVNLCNMLIETLSCSIASMAYLQRPGAQNKFIFYLPLKILSKIF